MRRLFLSAFLLGMLSTALALPAFAADLSDLVEGSPQKIVGDCKFTEGPAWHPDGYLLFSDIPNNRIIRVNPDDTHSDWMTASGGANGLMCDQAGNVYAAQGDEQQVARLRTGADGKGEIAQMLARDFDGKPLNKPNDLAIDTEGGLYFTDPNYRQAPPSQPVQGVYYVSRTGQVTRVIADLPRPNGILVSPDGKTLYVANIEQRKIMAYPIVAAGQLSEPRVLFTGDESVDGNGPDGMALDERGMIYATYKQIVVVSPDGQLRGRIEVPEKPANCAFGGEENRTLYITARTSLYKLPMKVRGMGLQKQGPQGTAVALALADDTPAATEELVKAKFQDITLEVPKSWKQLPAGGLRIGQFSIPAVDGDAESAELVVFPPFGGSIAANVQRWVQMFENEGKQLKMTKAECPQGKYVFVELTGTYKKPVGPPVLQQTEPAPNYKLLGVVLSMKEGGNYFLRLTGPKATVAAAAAPFRKSFGAQADKETPYEFGDE